MLLLINYLNNFIMKKLYSLTFLLLIQLTQAQLSENFDAATTLPAGWTAFRGTNNLGTGFDWGTSTARNYSPGNSAFVRYENVTGGNAEDWLVTPLIDLSNRTSCSLTFYGGQQYTDPYGTVYQVKVSTTSQTSHASFTNVATYAEADFTDILSAPLTSLKTVDLSAYNGQQIYIAFVMTQDDGDNWFIDNVNVTGTLSTPSFDDKQISIYPNPTNGILNVEAIETISRIEIFNILGSLVKATENSNKIDITELNSGTYFAKITSTEGKVKTQKIVKN